MSEERRQVSIIVIVTALFAAFLIWAGYTQLDLVTHGQGRVIALGQNRAVQAASRGTVLEYRVDVGARVETGDVIAVIDPTEARSQLTEAETRLRTLDTRLARLQAELDGDGLEGDVVAPETEDALVRAEYQLLAARKEDLVARVSALAQARLQKEREREGVLAEAEGVRRARALLETEAAQILPLVDVGALGVSEKFRIERSTAELETRAKVLAERLTEIAAALAEKDAEIEAARTGYLNAIYEERAGVMGQIAELAERLPALRQRVDQTAIAAPVTGIINQVFFNNLGAVVSEGEVIAEIVPTDGALQVEAMIAPEDIANIEPGQAARISLTAYNAAKYGTMSGKVLRVSADASWSEEMQARMFVVDASLDDILTEADGTPVTVLPGMIAQVDIVRGRRTVLEYIWNPVAKVRDRALRE